MLKLLLHWVLSALALILTSRLVPGFDVQGFRAALIAALACWLQRSRRALPAALLLAFAALNAIVTLTNRLGWTGVAGRGAGSVVVAALLIWLGLRAVRATQVIARTRRNESVASDAG